MPPLQTQRAPYCTLLHTQRAPDCTQKCVFCAFEELHACVWCLSKNFLPVSVSCFQELRVRVCVMQVSVRVFACPTWLCVCWSLLLALRTSKSFTSRPRSAAISLGFWSSRARTCIYMCMCMCMCACDWLSGRFEHERASTCARMYECVAHPNP